MTMPAQPHEPALQPADFWQRIEAGPTPDLPFYVHAYPAALDEGRMLWLPIRPLADGKHALASLIVNQASFVVLDALVEALAGKLEPHRPQIVVGLPTLGLTLASALARKLGHTRYVPLGTSRKFWYREELSVPLSSITTPAQQRRLYLDPRLVEMLRGQRVALIDDVISTGASMSAALDLMSICHVEPIAIVAAMLQSERWIDRLGELWTQRVLAALETPLLETCGDGWRGQTPGAAPRL